jgi:hypothetical protein
MKANQYLPKGHPAYQLKDFIPNSMDFLEPPQSSEEKKAALNRGLALMSGIPPEMMLSIIQAQEAKRLAKKGAQDGN